MNTQTQHPATTHEKGVTEYTPHGSQDPIKISAGIVANYIAVPTKSGKLPSERDCIKFVALCRSRRLNPFEGDCFLVGYDGQNGPQFSLITAHQAYLKRAEMHPEYDGMQSGVIVQDGEELRELEGDFFLDGQTLLGGWAKVHFKNRKIPTYRRIRLARFNTGRSQWATDPAGMIVKCAEADALRSSFPTMLGGLQMREEVEAGMQFPALPPAPQQPEQPKLAVVKEADEIPGAETPPASSVLTPQAELQDLVLAHGFGLDDFKQWAAKNGQLKDAEDLTSFDDLSDAEAKRFLRAQKGLITQLSAAKGQA